MTVVLTTLGGDLVPAAAVVLGTNGPITFAGNRNGGNGDIYLMDTDGTNPTRLTINPAIDADPVSLPTAPASPSPATVTATTRSM